MPPWLLNCTKQIKSDFLGVFFSLEAEARRNEIRLIQANKNKIETICYLLLSFGIIPSVGCTKKFATNTVKKTKRKYYFLDIRNIDNLSIFLREVGIIHEKAHLLKKHLASKPSGIYVKKHKFDYKKIVALSKYYSNYEEFCKDFKNILEVTRRTGHITEDALKSTKKLLLKINSHENNSLLELINEKLGCNICWLKVKEKRKIKYGGKLVDLTVPKFENFVGGYGGIYLHNTLSAFTSIINELLTLSEANQLEDKVYCVYCSPLRALSNDLEKNLREPLEAIKKKALEKGKELHIRVAVRTGDTPTAERAKMLRKPPHILILTPETMAIILNSPKFIEHLKGVQWVIVDEIHSMAGSKRGVHLSLSMERMQSLNPDFCRVGLSATISPLEEIAKFLVGMKNEKEPRDCKIVDVQFLKKLDLKVLSPLPDLVNTTKEQVHEKLYGLLHELIQEHKTTLIFTNTRSATERVVHNLKDLYSEQYSQANLETHHSSISREQRLNVEERLKQGKLKCVVSSTSLELGIDIGFIDLVILLGSPKSVARALQRMGRSGHRLHDTVKGRIIVLDRDDLVECAVLLKNAIEKHIDRIDIPQNCLDVLAQQVFGIAINAPCLEKEVFALVKHSYCYRNLERHDFNEIIKYLSGQYSTLETRHVYAKIWYDEESGMIGKRGKLARVLYMTNIGTIPDEARIAVKIGIHNIGTIDEIFLEHLRPNDVFVLGGQSYVFKYSRGNTAQVAPAYKRPPTVPSWFSEMLPLSFDLALEIQRFRSLMEEKFRLKKTKKEIIEFIHSYLYVDKNSSNAIFEYFREQFLYSKIPVPKKLIVEYYSDYENRYAVFHALYGRRVNDALSRVFAYLLGRMIHKDIEIVLSDNGFVLAAPILPLQKTFSLLEKNNLRDIAEMAIENSEIMGRRFRHCATRALMILRSYKGKTKTVGRQQMHSRLLLSAVRRIGRDFPILKETRREILEDLMDIKNAELIAGYIKSKKIKIVEINSDSPSPFAFNLFAQGYSDVLRMEGRIDFVKRMHEKVMKAIAEKEK
ncbi:MAG: ATP-dependent helicase [Candidatus ainarchaeum sp.]|nr:ATP-dependent helicase [Candidatus ainarchaeum sp.]